MAGAILKRLPILCSYTIVSQGKRYHRTRGHIRSIYLGIPVKATQHQWQTKTHTHKYNSSCIPKPKPHLHLVCQPKKHLPKPAKCLPSHIPIPQLPQATNASPTVNPLLDHLSTLNSPSLSPSVPVQLKLSSGTWPVPPTSPTWELHSTASPLSTSSESAPTNNPSSESGDSENKSSSISSLCSTASNTSTRTLRPKLPITYNDIALSQMHGRPQIRKLPNISILLPTSSKEESPTDSNSDQMKEEPPTTEAKADSQREASPVSTPSTEAEADPPHQDRSPVSPADRPEVSSKDSSTLKNSPMQNNDQGQEEMKTPSWEAWRPLN